MPRLNLLLPVTGMPSTMRIITSGVPYDEYTIPVRCPNQRFRAASAGRPCDHRTDLWASWPLRFCLTPHIDKFEKIVSP